MGKLFEHFKAKIQENRAMNQQVKRDRNELKKTALMEATAAYKKEYIRGAKQAVIGRARREAHERFGYSKAERRAKTVQNLAKELGGLNFGGQGKTTKTSPTKTFKKAKIKKQGNPFDVGKLNDFDMGEIFK